MPDLTPIYAGLGAVVMWAGTGLILTSLAAIVIVACVSAVHGLRMWFKARATVAAWRIICQWAGYPPMEKHRYPLAVTRALNAAVFAYESPCEQVPQFKATTPLDEVMMPETQRMLAAVRAFAYVLDRHRNEALQVPIAEPSPHAPGVNGNTLERLT